MRRWPPSSRFNCNITDIELTNSTTSATSGNLLAQPATVDFARYNGLQGLVDMTGCAAGNLRRCHHHAGDRANRLPEFLLHSDALHPGRRPSLLKPHRCRARASASTCRTSLTVNATGGVPVGLRLDFDLSKTIQVTNGSFRDHGHANFRSEHGRPHGYRGAHRLVHRTGSVPPTGRQPRNRIPS